MKKLFNIEDNVFLEIAVKHRDGGMNYFSGLREPKGVEVVFSKVTIQGNIRSCTITSNDNFRILAQAYNRKNNKTISKVEEFVEKLGSHLFDLYLLNMKDDIFNLVKNYHTV